jgi:hypothetical protein
MNNWMSGYGSIALNQLIIPASHNSGTYNITAKSRISPDSPTPLAALFPCIVAPISRCQDIDIIQQLNLGIRIFDIRICRRGDKDISQWIVHGQYSISIYDAFKDVGLWLEIHPKEVIIIVTRYLDGVDVHPLIDIIGSKYMARYPELTPKSKLSDFWGRNTNCVLIVDNYGDGMYWPSFDTIVSAWPNKQNTTTLKEWQDTNIPKTYGDKLWITQLILTPTFQTVISCGIPYNFAIDVEQDVMEWMSEWKSTNRALNGIMFDFADNQHLLSELIQMNSL